MPKNSFRISFSLKAKPRNQPLITASFLLANSKNIPSPATIKIADKITSLVKTNSVGSVKTEIIQTDANKIKINYEIKLEKRILSNENESKEYLDLVKEWSNILIKKWIIQEG